MSAVIFDRDFSPSASLAELSIVPASRSVPSQNVLISYETGGVAVAVPTNSGDLHLELAIAKFDLNFFFPVVAREFLPESGQLVLKANIDDGVLLVLTIVGRVSAADDTFQVNEVRGNLEPLVGTARSGFIVSTLIATFNLAGTIVLKIPEIGFQTTFECSELTLKEISEKLQHRQVFYRTMVIEGALGSAIQLPSIISGEDLTTLAMVYSAIVRRSFDWAIRCIEVEYSASDHDYSKLVFLTKQESAAFGPSPLTKMLLGTKIELGGASVTIERPFIERLDELRTEFSQNDSHAVVVQICSRIGRGHYDCPDAPYLPDAPWDARIQELVDIDSQLDEDLVKRYHRLAAATLDGLTQDERIAVTTRPTLDPVAFADEP